MDSTSVTNSQLIPLGSTANNLVSVVETPILGKPKARRITTSCKSAEGKIVSILVEEYNDNTLLCRQFDQHMPVRSTTREVFELDGTLISSETERREQSGQLTKIVVRGSGKSSTTRIMVGEVEARATERSVLIETPKASYTFQPFEGKWTSFYKEVNMKMELKANFLKSPNSTLNGPDGIQLVFRNGRLADMIVTHEQGNNSNQNSVPSIID